MGGERGREEIGKEGGKVETEKVKRKERGSDKGKERYSSGLCKLL